MSEKWLAGVDGCKGGWVVALAPEIRRHRKSTANFI